MKTEFETAIKAVQAVTDSNATRSLDLVEVIMAERQRRVHQTAAEVVDIFCRFLREEFGPWQNVNQ